MRELLAVWLALCAMACALPARAAELALANAARGQDISRHATVWRDADGSADLTAAQAADARGEFRPTRGASAFGMDRAPHWFRFDLRRPAGAAETWWIELPHPGLDDVRLYAPDGAGGVDIIAVGDHRPFAARPVQNRNFLFPVQLPEERTLTFYLRVQTADTLIVPLRVWHPGRFEAADHLEVALIGVYFGMILAMLVYNLFIYLQLRDRLYASYLAFSLVILLVVAELFGLSFEYLWPDNLWLADRQHVILPAAAVLTTLAFVRRFFDLAAIAPRLDRIMRALAGLTLAATVIGLAADYGLGHRLLLMILPLQSLAGIIAGVLALRRGYRPAIYFLLAQACFQGAVVLVVGNGLGWWTTGILIQQAIGIGSALEVLLFSQALAERIALVQRDKEAATRRADAAEIASASKSRILATVSHDLRQPIRALALFLDTLAKRPGDDDTRAIVAKMDASVHALSDLVETFLDLARLNAGAIEPKPRPVAISDVFERLIGEFEVQAHGAGLDMKVWLPRADVVVATDPALLATLLRNLLANAIRYTPHGGVLLACRRREGRWLLQVWDTGRGIPADECERIFDEYYRNGIAARDSGKGLGLGLAIVARIATLLGGRVAVRSRVGSGSVFELALPAAPA